MEAETTCSCLFGQESANRTADHNGENRGDNSLRMNTGSKQNVYMPACVTEGMVDHSFCQTSLMILETIEDSKPA